MIELEILFIQLFPEKGTRAAPFTLREIASVLSEAYNCKISYNAVHRAFAGMLRNSHTSGAVRPLHGSGRELLFSANAARRIARRAMNSQLPPKYKAAGKSPKFPVL